MVLQGIITLLIYAAIMPRPLEQDLLFLLADVGRLVRVHADRRAREDGMTRAQWVILARLERQDGLTQKALADLLEVEPITVGRLVDRLQARGLVERRADPTDRRVWRLHLTDAAAPILAGIAAYRAELHAKLTGGMPAEAVQALMGGLLQFRTNLCAGIRSADAA